MCFWGALAVMLEPFFDVFSSFFEKSRQKVCWNQKYLVPLQPQNQNDALVAQLVEHLTLNQGVQGSTPCRRTKEEVNESLSLFSFCFFGSMKNFPYLCSRKEIT